MLRGSLVVVTLGGCAAHVALVPIPPNPTPEQRLDAFNRLRATDAYEMVDATPNPDRSITLMRHPVDTLVTGQRITEPEDLLPVLPPDSRSARAARASHTARLRAWWSGATGLALAAIGGGLILDDGLAEGTPTLEARAGGALVIGGLIAGLIAYAGYTSIAEREATRSLATYDHDLRLELALCSVGKLVLPCEAPPPPPPAPPPPPEPSIVLPDLTPP